MITPKQLKDHQALCVIDEIGKLERMPPSRSDDGYALPLVLAIIAVLAGSIIASTAFFHASIRTLATTSDRIRMRVMIGSAIEQAAVTATLHNRTRPTPLSSGYQLSGASWSFSHSQENGRIDINQAESGLLAILFRYGGMNETGTQQLIDRIQSRRLGLGKGPDSAMTGTPMAYRSIDELLEQGLPASAFEKLAPFITVFSGRKEFDPRHSDISLFKMFPDLTNLQRRRINELISTKSTSSSAWSEAIGSYRSFLTFDESRVHRLRIRATLNNGMIADSEVVIIIFNDDIEPYRILYRKDGI